MSLPSSTATSGTPYVGNVDQAAVLANQPKQRAKAQYQQAIHQPSQAPMALTFRHQAKKRIVSSLH
nr:hypothetical protein [Oxalobacteraceae bacterium]